MSAERRFVVVSGLPGSGKSSLAPQLAPLLGLAVIDKDDILEGLYESKGIGDSTWRRALSRESDLIFQQESEASEGALLVSHWHLPGMPPNSGTPTDWLGKLTRRIVNLHCECPAEVAVARFTQRKRHHGHLDEARSSAQILAGIQDLARFQLPAIGERVLVDTSAAIKLDDLVGRILRAFSTPA
jgi:hypothetical protein